jgi:hypothetical protein
LVDGPVVDGKQVMSVDQESYLLWIKSLETLEPEHAQEGSALNEALATLATRIHLQKTKKKKQHLEAATSILSFWNCIAATIANSELASRQENYFDYGQYMGNASKSGRDMHNLVNAGFRHQNILDKEHSILKTMWNNLMGYAK